MSYRWQEPALKTTAESIAAFRREIPLQNVQNQLRDAFLISKRLGIRYVWVDALVGNL
jgi:hypothetical protein